MNASAFIKVIGPHDADASKSLKDTYAYVRSLLPVSRWYPHLNIVKAFSLRPAYLRAFGEAWATMWHGPLPLVIKEAIGTVVSNVNRCQY